MTDRIDLDELADEPAEDEEGNPGDWLWRDDADPPGGDTAASDSPPVGSGGTEQSTDGDDSTPRSADADATTAGSTPDRDDRPIPHVPHPNKNSPVGIPVEGGGAGGGRPNESKSGSQADNDTGETAADGEQSGPADATGPHGGDADDMTLAFSFDALKQFDDPAAVLADANQWADWIGIVGDVEAHVINKFQRDHRLDVDFFNGTGTGPGERLAEVDPHSMFFAERMVLVGLPGRDESIAADADWEFVGLETAAAEADWTLREP